MKGRRQYLDAKKLGTAAIILDMIAILWVGICCAALTGSWIAIFVAESRR